MFAEQAAEARLHDIGLFDRPKERGRARSVREDIRGDASLDETEVEVAFAKERVSPPLRRERAVAAADELVHC